MNRDRMSDGTRCHRDKVGDKKGYYPDKSPRVRYKPTAHKVSSGCRTIDERWDRMAAHKWCDPAEPQRHGRDNIERPIVGTWKDYQPTRALARFNPDKFAKVKL